jgi:putative MATE family efflux protein
MLNSDIKKILSIATPAALNQLLDMLQVLIDMIFVGRISPVAVASVGLSMNLIGALYSIIGIFSVGVNALVARFYGAKEFSNISSLVTTAVIFSFFFSIPITLIVYFHSYDFFMLFGKNTEIATTASLYMQIISVSIPFLFIGAVFISTYNGFGNTKVPLIIGIFTNLLNTILDYILIFGNFGFPQLGVKGAAIATTTSYIFEVVVFLLLIIFKGIFKLSKDLDFNLARKLFKIGIPAGIERFIIYGSFFVFIWIISLYGTYVLAGYQIGLRVEGLAFMPGFGFSIAAMTLVGQSLGAKNPEDAYKYGIKTALIAAFLMQFIGFFMFFYPEFFVSIFTSDKNTIKEASLYLKVVAISQFPLAIDFVLSGALRGAGATKLSLLVNTSSLWIFRLIPSILVTIYFKNILIIYFIMIFETYIKAIILWYIFKKGKWREVSV